MKLSFTLKQELSLAKVLIIFAFPVLVTGLAETALFDAIGNYIVGAYLASEQLVFTVQPLQWPVYPHNFHGSGHGCSTGHSRSYGIGKPART